MKIDIVYTWVDGSDANWNSKRNSKLKEMGIITPNSNNKALFEDNNELKYSLRSLAKFIPWVNKIFIVTDGQIPKWLNTANPKIKIIDHKDIFSDYNNLPAFNSCSIETQLHHIKELSEHYVYFNDDMFMGNDCEPNFFFTKNGKPRIFTAEIIPIPKKKLFDIRKRDPLKINIHQEQIVRTRNLLRDKLNKTVYVNLRHGAKPLLKSKMYELENVFSNELAKTSMNSFRTPEDIIIIYLFSYWAVANKAGAAKYLRSVNLDKKISFLGKLFSKFTFGYINLHDTDLLNYLENLKYAKPSMFCLNQTPDTSRENLLLLHNFLEQYLPEKSEFEK